MTKLTEDARAWYEAQLSRVRSEAEAEAYERAAKAVEELPWFIEMSPDHIRGRRPKDIAETIRALAASRKGMGDD